MPLLGTAKGALLCERVQHAHSCLTKVRLVTGDDREIVNQRRRGNLFIQGVLGMRHSQAAPQLRNVCIDIQYKVPVLAQQRF
jgi:hypothetical protein